MTEFIYTRNGTKCRVIHEDEHRIFAAVQITHQSVTYNGDDYEEHEEDGEIWQLSPSQCFDAPPTIQVSEELVALEKRAHEVRAEIHQLKQALKAAQKEHDEKMDALKERHGALARIDEYIDGGITHYVISDYGMPEIVSVEDTLEEMNHSREAKKRGRLLTLTPDKIWSGELVWRLNLYRDGSGSERNVHPCASHDEALEHLQAWVSTQAEGNGVWGRKLWNFAQKHGLSLPLGYKANMIAKEKAGLEKAERKAQDEQRKKRQEKEAEWKALGAS